MTIQEILEAHLRVMGQRGTGVLCICGWRTIALGKRSEDLHRAHVAEVLDKHMHQTRRGVWDRAYSAGWNDEVWRDNPYTDKDTSNGR